MPKINDIILNSILDSSNPVDFNLISDSLTAENLSPNKTTIYRNLEKLESEGLIQKVLLSDQKQYWEKIQSDQFNQHFHFHLICNLCKKIECRELSKVLDLGFNDFQIQKTDFNLFGLCQNCS
jgi:Fe2+ or Zn2+ uptake regulation protein